MRLPMQAARLAVFALLVLGAVSCGPVEDEDPPNILFIAIDDLRPELGAYGENHMVTPHMDRLAESGVLFTRHYTQVATCGASRRALLTGQHPSGSAHLRNSAIVDTRSEEEPDHPESFVHHFKRNGYRTIGIGKIGHFPDGEVYEYDGTDYRGREMPYSWHERGMPHEKWGTAWNAFFAYADGTNRNMERGAYPAFEHPDVPDDAYPDGLIAEEGIRHLRQLKDGGEPFLLALGFLKPHLPFSAPDKYWRLYDQLGINLSPNPEAPDATAADALHASSEMFRNYFHEQFERGEGIRIPDDKAVDLRRAYFASVSYVDAQVGKVLAELEQLGLRDNTIVVLWGDHGWHLGDQTIWGKHSTFERAVRSAMIVDAPGDTPGQAEGIIETVDIYPTLIELTGLDLPAALTGQSFVRLLKDPSANGKAHSVSYWRNRTSIRTDRYRLNRFRYENDSTFVELFDHTADPLETNNVAESHPEEVSRLVAALDESGLDFVR